MMIVVGGKVKVFGKFDFGIRERCFEQELVGKSAGRGNEGAGGGRESEVLGSIGGFSE